jgi:hypothetical protein
MIAADTGRQLLLSFEQPTESGENRLPELGATPGLIDQPGAPFNGIHPIAALRQQIIRCAGMRGWRCAGDPAGRLEPQEQALTVAVQYRLCATRI